jgi:hypothetical protein
VEVTDPTRGKHIPQKMMGKKSTEISPREEKIRESKFQNLKRENGPLEPPMTHHWISPGLT